MSPNDESAPMHDVLLAAVAQQTSALLAQAEHLANAATELKGAYRFSRQLKMIFAVSAFAMVLLLGLCVGLTVIALQNRANGGRARESIAAIKDCTEATGRCYQKQQQQGALFMAQIISRNVEGFIVVSECSRATTTNAALEACVRHRLPR